LLADPQDISPIVIPSTEDEPGSPPVMLIEEDGDAAYGFPVQSDPDDHFDRFVFPALGDYSNVVRELPKYIQGCMLRALLLHIAPS
jgi:ubiquitin carboxyl-terminal hydrolase 34